MEKSNKDWDGNKRSAYATLGASNHTDGDRAENDYYATDPATIKPLFDREEFSPMIWEPAAGEGHLSKAMIELGKTVYSTDIVDRGYSVEPLLDFLNYNGGIWHGDIITNPPYKYAHEFVEKAMEIISDGSKVAMFLKIQFLEGQKRAELFKKYPPMVVYVFSRRQICAKNGDFESRKKEGSAVAYAWYVWEKGFKGDPIIKWIN
jgi:hypothetical protein